MPLGEPLKSNGVTVISQLSGLAKESAFQDAPCETARSSQQDNQLVQFSEQHHPQLPT